MSDNNLTKALEIVLADAYTLYLKTQNYHWNVTGLHFKPLHEMFEEQYDALKLEIDEVAERIRTLGAKAPGSYKAFAALTTIEEATGAEDAKTMVANLAADQDRLIASVTSAMEIADDADDEGTEAMLSELLVAHEKTRWMLQATAG